MFAHTRNLFWWQKLHVFWMNYPFKEVNIFFPLLVLGLRDFLRGSSQLLIFADEALRLLPHGFLRVLQPLLQVCDPPVQRRQVRVRLSDLHRRRGRHARDAEDESTGPVKSLSSTTTPHRWDDHLPRVLIEWCWTLSPLNLNMRDATAATRDSCLLQEISASVKQRQSSVRVYMQRGGLWHCPI